MIELDEKDIRAIGYSRYMRENGNPNKLQRIRVTDAVIIDDTLTEFYLRQRIMFVIRALVLIREVVKKNYKEMGFAVYSAEQRKVW